MLLQRLGPRYSALLNKHHQIIRDAISAFEGSEEVAEGDGLFITFRSPSKAIAAAVTAQVQLQRASWPPDARIRVRMGAHLGEVEATQPA